MLTLIWEVVRFDQILRKLWLRWNLVVRGRRQILPSSDKPSAGTHLMIHYHFSPNMWLLTSPPVQPIDWLWRERQRRWRDIFWGNPSHCQSSTGVSCQVSLAGDGLALTSVPPLLLLPGGPACPLLASLVHRGWKLSQHQCCVGRACCLRISALLFCCTDFFYTNNVYYIILY